MPEISPEQSQLEVTAITDRVQRAIRDRDPEGELVALQDLAAHPCAPHQIDLPGVWEEIHQLHKRSGRFDEAIAAKRRAVRAGYRSTPHPDADIAECHLLAGRRAEADRIFADLRTRTPDDVWLYNSAGFAYSDTGDPEESARWFREGIDLALRSGDPEQVVNQLLDGLQAAERASARPTEPGLADRVAAFVESWTRPPDHRPTYWGDPPATEDRPCPHCGDDPRPPVAETVPPEIVPSEPRAGRGRMVTSLAWFPAGEWELACAEWPDLLDQHPAAHVDYSHGMESHLKRLARVAVGQPIRVSPVTVAGLTAFSEEEGKEAGSSEARARFAAEIGRRGESLPWPPGRNSPCWCGSGRKYKVCCGPVRPATA